MEPVWSVGLMTGTVLDGHIDVALLHTDGEGEVTFGPYALVPYPDDIKALLPSAVAAARDWAFEGPEPAVFAEAEAAITMAQAQAVQHLMATAGLTPANISVVGFHGQTVLHRAPTPTRIGATRQLGDGALMASLLGIDVTYDFRSADVRAGGQGAPLAAIYHQALLRSAGPNTAVLNIGGVANLTWAGAAGELVAFDTGPGNAPINDFVRAHGAGDMDRDGRLAAAGQVNEGRLIYASAHKYLTAPYPKSLDRFDFGHEWVGDLSLTDGAATLTAFIATAVHSALDMLPQRPEHLLVCGGGRHNPTLMAMLADRAGVTAAPAEAAGWRGDAIEAECFAYLAVRTQRGLPSSFPTTTGVPSPLIAGRIARANTL